MRKRSPFLGDRARGAAGNSQIVFASKLVGLIARSPRGQFLVRPVFVTNADRRCGQGLLLAILVVLALLLITVWMLRYRHQAVPQTPMHDRTGMPALQVLAA